MSMCTLGMAEEFRDDGIAFNALWPRTIIATAAVQNLLGGDEAMAALAQARAGRGRGPRDRHPPEPRVHRQPLPGRGRPRRGGITDMAAYSYGAAGGRADPGPVRRLRLGGPGAPARRLAEVCGAAAGLHDRERHHGRAPAGRAQPVSSSGAWQKSHLEPATGDRSTAGRIRTAQLRHVAPRRRGGDSVRLIQPAAA